jgi:hypothetical protein
LSKFAGVRVAVATAVPMGVPVPPIFVPAAMGVDPDAEKVIWQVCANVTVGFAVWSVTDTVIAFGAVTVDERIETVTTPDELDT